MGSALLDPDDIRAVVLDNVVVAAQVDVDGNLHEVDAIGLKVDALLRARVERAGPGILIVAHGQIVPGMAATDKHSFLRYRDGALVGTHDPPRLTESLLMLRALSVTDVFVRLRELEVCTAFAFLSAVPIVLERVSIGSVGAVLTTLAVLFASWWYVADHWFVLATCLWLVAVAVLLRVELARERVRLASWTNHPWSEVPPLWERKRPITAWRSMLTVSMTMWASPGAPRCPVARRLAAWTRWRLGRHRDELVIMLAQLPWRGWRTRPWYLAQAATPVVLAGLLMSPLQHLVAEHLPPYEPDQFVGGASEMPATGSFERWVPVRIATDASIPVLRTTVADGGTVRLFVTDKRRTARSVRVSTGHADLWHVRVTSSGAWSAETVAPVHGGSAEFMYKLENENVWAIRLRLSLLDHGGHVLVSRILDGRVGRLTSPPAQPEAAR